MTDLQPHHEIMRLDNGLRCVLARRPGVTYCGLAVGAGTRDESDRCQGLAHFVEHTLFKGTGRRSSAHISSRMESVGGELNAYTTKEETLIYTVAPHGYLDRALDLLADLVQNSKFPDSELEKEKEVVIDEINSYLDSPGEAIFDEFEDLLYRGSPLGHNILGTPESVKDLTRQDCLAFLQEHYTPHNMVLYCVGNVEPRHAIKRIEKFFGSMPPSCSGLSANRLAAPAPYMPFDQARDLGLHQCHTLVGTRLYGRQDPRRYALFLLNNYLGGPAMNSVLNRELRDKRGYVYTVDSMTALLSDCGAFQVYFGCDARHIKPCRRIIAAQLERLAETPMKPRVFEAARRQYIGQLQVASSYAESQAMNLGKSVLYYDKVLTPESTAHELMGLAPEHLMLTARMICESGLSCLTLC